jgi:hypothetical protein
LKNLVLSSKKPKTEIGSLEEPCFGALLSNSGSNEIGTAHRVGQGSARAGRCEAALGQRWVGSGKAGSGEAGRGEATLEQRQVGMGEADPRKRETRKELHVGEERNTRMNISHFLCSSASLPSGRLPGRGTYMGSLMFLEETFLADVHMLYTSVFKPRNIF